MNLKETELKKRIKMGKDYVKSVSTKYLNIHQYEKVD